MSYQFTFHIDRKAKPGAWGAVAVIFGGEHNGEVVFWERRERKSQAPSRIELGSKHDSTEGDPSLEEEEEDEGLTRITLPRGCAFQQTFTNTPRQRDVWYIAGAAGSGKSTYAGKGMRQYVQVRTDLVDGVRRRKREDPEDVTPCVKIASEKPADPALDDALSSLGLPPPERITMRSIADMYAASKNPDDRTILERFKRCLLIIDDVDALKAPLKHAVAAVIDKVLLLGRADAIDVILCQHALTDGMEGRMRLQEATHFVLFPGSTTTHQLRYLMEKHLGMGRDDVAALSMNGVGRWIVIHKNVPRYAMTESGRLWML